MHHKNQLVKSLPSGPRSILGLFITFGVLITSMFLLSFMLFHIVGSTSVLSTPPALAAIVTENPNPNPTPLPAAIPDVIPDVPPQAVQVSTPPKNSIPKIAVSHLIIAKIGVNAVIKNLGLTSSGVMAVPGNNTEVGLFSLGAHPGSVGTAVIGGHNIWASKPGIFARLPQLEKGDLLSVIDANGVSTTFIVRDIHNYSVDDDHGEVFTSSSGIHLNLITCSGVWDPSTKSNTERLVIFTDAI